MEPGQAEPMGEGSQNPHELSLDLPAAHSAGRMARQVLRKFAEGEGVPEAEVQTLEFVADELMTNAIDHGGGESAMEEADLKSDVRMQLLVTVKGGEWELRVEDQGGGAPEDVAHVVGSDALPDLEDERGRGFFLMGQMVDGLKVEKSRDGRGLAFVATKRYVPAEG
jgi:anti-sigma regulatory factor (Ser/Thr protein kinase)